VREEIKNKETNGGSEGRIPEKKKKKRRKKKQTTEKEGNAKGTVRKKNGWVGESLTMDWGLNMVKGKDLAWRRCKNLKHYKIAGKKIDYGNLCYWRETSRERGTSFLRSILVI